MLYVGKFLSFILLLTLELSKIAAVILAACSFADARNNYALASLDSPKRKRWLRSYDWYSFDHPDLIKRARYHPPEFFIKRAHARFAWGLLFYAGYAALQFGLCRVDRFSLVKFITVSLAIAIFALFAVFGTSPRNRAPVWHRLVVTGAVSGALLVGACIAFGPDICPYYNGSGWVKVEEEVLSEEITRIDPFAVAGIGTEVSLRLEADGSTGLYFNDDRFQPAEKNSVLVLVRDPDPNVTSAFHDIYLLRKEVNIFTRYYTCRLPIVWCHQKEHLYRYELHYTEDWTIQGSNRLPEYVALQ